MGEEMQENQEIQPQEGKEQSVKEEKKEEIKEKKEETKEETKEKKEMDAKEEKKEEKEEKQVKEEKEVKEVKEEKEEKEVKEEKGEKENGVQKEWDHDQVSNYLREIIKQGNTDQLTLKTLRLSCAKQFPKVDTDQKSFKAWLKSTLVSLLEEEGEEEEEEEDAEMENEDSEEEEEEESEEESEEEEEPKPRKRKRAAPAQTKRNNTKKPSKSSKSSESSSGGNAYLSPELAAVVGTTSETNCFKLVKLLWAYIKSNELQNPKNKREILCDDKLKAVFGRSKVNGFSMSKYLPDHIIKEEGADEPAKKKAKGEKKPRAEAKTDNMPYLSTELQKVCGIERGNHFRVVKHLWIYIKQHELQNPKNKKEILCDKNLQAVFNGKKVVTTFGMTKFISQHLTKPSEM